MVQAISNKKSKTATQVLFAYTGSDQTYTVPAGIATMTVQAWGAGGATPGAGSTAYNIGNSGGGGYTTAIFNVTSGSTVKVIVGQGGTLGSGSTASTATYGGGGYSFGNGSSNWGQASGGGRSAVQLLVSSTYVEILTAGGGGAAGQSRASSLAGTNICYGGGGGGLTGGENRGTYSEGGGGGTSSAGGVAGSYSGGSGGNTAGGQFIGGNGWCGAGGGGYYGGGGGGVISSYGSWTAGGGGGGSSYVNATYLSATPSQTITQGSSPAVANNAGLPSNVINTIGNGVVANPVYNAVGNAGQNGYVIITFNPASSAGVLQTLSSSTKTNAIGIYAFKLCFTSYTGPVVTIRRVSDNTTSDFYANNTGTIGTSNNGGGTSLSSWLTSTTGYVTKWYDQSGKGNHMTQTTTTSQPQIILNDAGGICIYFTASVSGGQLTTATTGIWPATTTTNYHIHDVTKVLTLPPSGGNELISLIGANSPRVHHPWGDGNIYFDSPDRVNTAAAITLNKKIICNFCKSAATGKITLVADGAMTQAGIGTANSSVTCIALNTQWDSNHYMYEMSVYNAPLYGTADMTLLDSSF
jgi:hypothetical protein